LHIIHNIVLLEKLVSLSENTSMKRAAFLVILAVILIITLQSALGFVNHVPSNSVGGSDLLFSGKSVNGRASSFILMPGI
jgi:hypothetical protein